MTGVYRFILHHDIERHLALGWRWCCSLGDDSSLMWWCCGACSESEVP